MEVIRVSLSGERLVEPCPHIPKILVGSKGCTKCQYFRHRFVSGEFGVYNVTVECAFDEAGRGSKEGPKPMGDLG